MGSPPCLKRSTVEPLTTRAERTPLLSQSMNPTPPLIDSTMYFFSGEAIWGTVRPAREAISSQTGMGERGLPVCALLPIHKRTMNSSGNIFVVDPEPNSGLL